MAKLTKAESVKTTSPRWLWDGRVPMGGITIIEGDPGTSKSTVTTEMAAHVSRGDAWPDGETCEQGYVLMANGEDPGDSIVVPRLIAAGADLSHVRLIDPDDVKGIFQIPNDVRWLEDMTAELSVRLIILDPLDSFLGESVNVVSNSSYRRGMRSLERFAQQKGCAIVVVRHLNKSSDKAGMYRGGGSIAIIAAARSAYLVAHDPADKNGGKLMTVNKPPNWAKPKDGLRYRTVSVDQIGSDNTAIKTSKIEWTGTTTLTASDILAARADIQGENVIADVSEWLLGAVADMPEGLDVDDIMKAGRKLGFEANVITRTAKLLGLTRVSECGVLKWRIYDAN